MYTQITAAERYTLARLRQHGYPTAAIARLLGRHRSTIHREIRRNATHHGGQKQCRKRYGHYDRRGRLAGKRAITERPAIVEARSRIGDWEADTILGPEGHRHWVLSLVERKTGYLVLGKLPARTVAAVNHRALRLLRQQPHPLHTLTCDNGTEFHGYAKLEAATNVRRPRKRLGYRTPEECYAR